VAEEEKNEAEDEGKEKDAAEAGGGESEGQEGAAAPKKKKPMLLIVGGIIGTLVLVGGAVAFFMLSGSGHGEGEEASVVKEASGKPIYYPLGDMIVNLSGEGRRPNYLKVKVTLELADEKDTALMDMIKPRIIDNFQVYLRELRIEDLRGSAGMYRLREELLMRVTEAAQPVRVRDVLFQEMLVQ